jgi:hypothetical protein
MIQRIQTIYLLLAAIALVVLTLGVNVYSYSIQKEGAANFETNVNSYGIQIDGELDDAISEEDQEALRNFLKLKDRSKRLVGHQFSSFPYYIFSLFLTMLVLGIIFLYKKQASQLRLGRLAFVISLSLFVLTLILYYSMKSQFMGLLDGAEVKSYLGLGFYMILAATAFLFLANIGIKRDISLLKSIDRIR